MELEEEKMKKFLSEQDYEQWKELNHQTTMAWKRGHQIGLVQGMIGGVAMFAIVLTIIKLISLI